MVWFIVIGEGRPVRTILDRAIVAPGAVIEALFLDEPARNPLAAFASRHGIKVFDRRQLELQCRRIANRQGGWLISANSTAIIAADVLDLFEGRSLNFHPGLLPEYAGLHTHQWAIRNGETEFGVTIHRIERGIDTGAIVGQVRFPIRPDDTGLSLFSRCLTAGAELFSRVIAQIIRGEPLADVPQDLSRRRLYRHREALEDRVDWTDTPVRIIDFIRAGNYQPLASPTYVARLDRLAGFDIKLLRAAAGGPSAAPPGTVVEVATAGPLIACRDGATIRIVRATDGARPMTPERWNEYVAQLPGHRLLGRGEAQAGRGASRKRQSIVGPQ